MARKRNGRRRRRRLGSVITVKRLSGVERLSNPSSMTGIIGPLAIGGLGAVLATLGIRQWVTPTPDNAVIVDNAQWVGLGIGGLLGLVLWNVTGKPAGLLAMGGAGLATLATKLPDMVAAGGLGLPAGTAGVRRGVGAIVPEYRRNGMGAIVMQPATTGSYGPGGGESVSLHGLSAAVIPSAFGRPTFSMR